MNNELFDQACTYLRNETTSENRSSFLGIAGDSKLANKILVQVLKTTEILKASSLSVLSNTIYTVVYEDTSNDLLGSVRRHITINGFKDEDHFCDCLASLFVVYPERFTF